MLIVKVLVAIGFRPSAAAGTIDYCLPPRRGHWLFYPPSQKTTAVRPWMNAHDGPSEAPRAKEGASADSAEE